MTPRPKMKRKTLIGFLLLTALAIGFTPARICAGENAAGQSASRNGNTFFLLTDAELSGDDSNILCVKSSVSAENMRGDAYIILSDLELDGGFDGRIYSLFSRITVHSLDQAEPDFVRGFFGLPALGRWSRGDGQWVFNGVPPGWVLALNARVLRIAFILGAAALRRSFFAQGAGFVHRRTLRTARNGLLFFFGACAVIAVFMLSAVGVPLALLAFCALAGVTLAGEASLGLAVCNVLLAEILPENPDKRRARNASKVYAKITVGVIIIELSRLIPYFVNFADWFLLPVLCSGAVITALYEGFVKKVFLAYE